ncbi:hypothetical protein Zm00014a_021533 [Zea mays]|uniref:Uncharacterized protein n=2 Tax=Zea mays TaxID=4577 RepID=A0A8J8Y319_MAIZE|nr:Glycosyl hydrolase superfamily protein [Zea mays]PWZ07404.1 hypothetical protein Zm00014a_021533 [Zea mays]
MAVWRRPLGGFGGRRNRGSAENCLESTSCCFTIRKEAKGKNYRYNINRDKGYGGIVLKSWSRWAIYGMLDDQELRYMVLEFVKQLGEALHSVNSKSSSHHLELIYVIPAPRMQKLNNQDFDPKISCIWLTL